ncbi:alpha/beta hydrolase family protein [Rhizobacter sp. P5_C2]
MRLFTAACALLLAVFAHAAPVADAPLATDPLILKLTNPRGFYDMKLSPDGKHLVALGYTSGNNAVFVIDTGTLAARKIDESNVEVRPRHIIRRVFWINNELLAIDYSHEDTWSVDLDGKRVTALGDWFIGRAQDVDDLHNVVLMQKGDGVYSYARVDALTGKSIPDDHGVNGYRLENLFDEQGVLRFVATLDRSFWSDNTRVIYWYRSDGNAAFRRIADFGFTEERWEPIAFGHKADTLIVFSREGRDTWALFSHDVTTGRHLEMLAGADTQDLASVQHRDTEEGNHDLVRVTTSGLKPTQVWLDARMVGLQKAVDAAMPGHVNHIVNGRPTGKLLILSFADTDPGRWMLLDTQDMTLREIAKVRTEVDPSTMRPMETLRYPTPDGLSIPAYFTRPTGAGAASLPPLVVLIHGGPIARDRWGWDEEVQALAQRGYAVFQPQFRGSYGFGRKFEEAGYHQWGLSMQDDVTNGVRYLIDQKLVDPQRICIYGASYGGYAALWGLIKTPELFRCGVSVAGVTDISLYVKDADFRKDKDTMKAVRLYIGDPSTQQQALDAVSPLKHADLVRAPVLLIHGERDGRVPIEHAEKMRDALKAAGKPVEWMAIKNAGHGFELDDRRRLYETLLAFLDKHIGKPAAAAAAASAP